MVGLLLFGCVVQDPGVRMIGTVNTQIQPLPKNGRTCPADLTVVTNPPVDYFTLAEATNVSGTPVSVSTFVNANNKHVLQELIGRFYLPEPKECSLFVKNAIFIPLIVL